MPAQQYMAYRWQAYWLIFVASLSHSEMPRLFIYFNLFLVPSLGLLPFSLFVYFFCLLFFCFPVLMCLLLFYLIIFHVLVIPIEACSLSNNRQNPELRGTESGIG